MAIFSFLFNKHLDKSILVISIAASLLLLGLEEDNKVNSARKISSFLLAPVEEIDKYFVDIARLRDENDKLREILAALYYERGKLLQFEREKKRMRKLLNFRMESHYRFLPCEIVSMSSNRFHHSVTIDRGSGDGVVKGMPVSGYRGIAGRVTQVFPSSSRVILINNRSLSISCRDRRSRVVGILKWDRGRYFNLDFIGSEEDVIVGDTLVTSGLGKVFPRGFQVGVVRQVRKGKGRISKDVTVVSMVDPGRLEELFVIMSGKEWDYRRISRELGKLKNGAE
ncbi:MAG: rod shape-determining protein MreC [Candidatus Krumholzibacteriota bacterium]|nr:rod shape-determining protein MreC [Candidatus Krumholzibacteriota bacterium]